MKNEAWLALLGGDPRDWLLSSGEPAARLIALTDLLDYGPDSKDVLTARREVLQDAATQKLLARLPDWEKDNNLSGHASPGFAPNLLGLLAEMGLGGGDDDRVEALLDSMLAHQDARGRFQSFGRPGHGPGKKQARPRWGSLLCDSHAIIDVLVRYGRGKDARTQRGLERMWAERVETAQGWAWPCVPDADTGFRGPGRKADFCPQVTLEALRVFARLGDAPGGRLDPVPAGPRRGRLDPAPAGLLETARVVLGAWRRRHAEKPYMFGHGPRFQTVKWPMFWYDVGAVLDTLSRFPALWRGPAARREDRQALAEMAACLVCRNFGPDGRVVPRSVYRGFEGFSFGQKKGPSAFATARLASVLRRLDDLAEDIQAVDVSPSWEAP